MEVDEVRTSSGVQVRVSLPSQISWYSRDLLSLSVSSSDTLSYLYLNRDREKERQRRISSTGTEGETETFLGQDREEIPVITRDKREKTDRGEGQSEKSRTKKLLRVLLPYLRYTEHIRLLFCIFLLLSAVCCLCLSLF